VLLLTLGVDLLLEVAPPVEQANGDEGQSEIRGGLDVIAGQHAQPSRVKGDRGVNPVFGAQIGDRPGEVGLMVSLPPRVLTRHVVGELADDLVVAIVEAVAAFQGLPSAGIHRAEQLDRVVVSLPCDRVDGRPKVAGGRVPGPPHVVGEFVQPPEGGWDADLDGVENRD
jgi:hypothetical protein